MTQYTLRNVPNDLDQALRRAASEAGKSLNQTAVEILRRGLGVADKQTRRRDLSDLGGTWQENPEVASALADQRRIDPQDWS